MTHDMLDQGRRILASRPFSVLMGATLDTFETGRVEMRMPLVPALLGNGLHDG